MNNFFRLGRIAATISVSNVEQAFDFYKNVFGLECTFTNGQPVGFAILKRDDAELHLTLKPGHRGTDRNVAHLMVSDANALYEKCESLKVRIVKGLKTHDFGLRAFVIADPDGNRIDIGQAVN
jgi:lactoylglutathione lyase